MFDPLFQPHAIAVIGASGTPGKVGHFMLKNLIESGFEGKIVPVNPHADEILGLPCLKKIAASPDSVDLALIIVPRDQVKEVVRQSLDAGVQAIVVISSGFRESGDDGAALEHEIAQTCKLRKVRMLGPNCLGLINTHAKLNIFYGMSMPQAGGISMISQSSSLCAAFVDRMSSCNLGVAKVVNIGNKADISEIDLLRWLAGDDKTKIIVAYLEGITNGDEFVKAAEEVSLQKPVVILKGATTDSGRKAVAAHTGMVLGTDTAYGAAFKRAGVIRAENFDDLFDFAAAFSLLPLPEGKRVLVISNAGAPGIMALDTIEKCALTPAVLSRESVEAFGTELPRLAALHNPVDLGGDGRPETYGKALAIAQTDPGVDAIVVVFVNRISCQPDAIAKAIVENWDRTKPVTVSFIGGEQTQAARRLFRPGGIPDYNNQDDAVQALRALWDYVAWKKRPPRIVTRFKVHRRRVERIITRRLRTNRYHLSDLKAKTILQAYDFQIPEGTLVTTVEEAIENAERIGYPVAMKIVSPQIIHKSDVGGVKLNLSNRAAIRDAYDLMMLRIGQNLPQAYIDGVYIEKMLDRGLEVILGMNRDPQFGPMLMFGLGGIFVEVLKDVAFHLAPITFDEAVQMLVSTRSYEILVGSKGEKGFDLEAIAQCLQRVSQLATDFPQVSELDINPLIVGETGTEPRVADARIILKPIEGLK